MRIALAGFAGFVAGFGIMMMVPTTLALATSTAVITASLFLAEAAVMNKLDEMDKKLEKKA